MLANYEHHITVSLADIDENGHANNQCYLRWMNEAAIAHSAANGWTSQRYLDIGLTWFARKHTIEYLLPTYQGEKIAVLTGITGWRNISSTRSYRFIRIKDDKTVAVAETLWAFVNLATGKPTRIPDEVTQSFTVIESV